MPTDADTEVRAHTHNTTHTHTHHTIQVVCGLIIVVCVCLSVCVSLSPGHPVFTCGPFANIAHGNSSIIADQIALKVCAVVLWFTVVVGFVVSVFV